MKRETMKKVRSLLLMLAMAILFVVPAYAAATKPDFGDKKVLVWETHTKEYTFDHIYDGKVTVTKVTSSKPNIIEVKKSENGFTYRAKKKGSSNITIKAKYNGKNYTIKKVFRYAKLQPFAYISVDGKKVYKNAELISNVSTIYGKSSYDLSGSLQSAAINKKLGSSVKFKWKLRPGWKLVSADYNQYIGNRSFRYTGKSVKNGGKVKLTKGAASVIFTLMSSKKERVGYAIHIYKTDSVN